MYQSNDEALATIYQTKDYRKFKLNDFNRDLSERRIESLKKEFRHNHNVPPIEVSPDGDGKLVIVDGQHRFAALQALGMPVAYYATYLKDYDTTQGMRSRNKGKAWSSMDTVVSFANNPHNAGSVREQYKSLLYLIKATQLQIGRVPFIPLIEMAEGINRAIDQPLFKRQDYSWQNGKFQMRDSDSFLNTIGRIHQLQKNVAHFSMKAATFRALFTMCTDDDINLDYFADLINQNRSAFENIITQNNDATVLTQLLGFYNSQVLIKPQYHAKVLASAKGVTGRVVMQGPKFSSELFLK